MKCVNWPKPDYAQTRLCTTKFNDSSILITIISCDYLNLSLADEHVGDVSNINPGNYQVQPKFSPGGLANQIAVFKWNQIISQWIDLDVL